MWSQFTNVTDRRTDRQTTCDRDTALCTKVHRAVKTTQQATTLARALFRQKINKNHYIQHPVTDTSVSLTTNTGLSLESNIVASSPWQWCYMTCPTMRMQVDGEGAPPGWAPVILLAHWLSLKTTKNVTFTVFVPYSSSFCLPVALFPAILSSHILPSIRAL